MIIISNTVLALTGSCLSAFAFSIFYRGKFCMDDVLNATIAGGVAIGSAASFITNPAGAIAIGFISGAVSATGYYYLSDFLTDKGIYDTCGIHNLHGMPGIIGGLSSAVFVAAYNSTSLDIAGGNPLDFVNGEYLRQGGLQVAGTFISLGMGLLTGAIAGLVIYPMYEVTTEDFYDDEHYWEIHHHKHSEEPPYYVVIGKKPD
jgi:ammonium transporter Rh